MPTSRKWRVRAPTPIEFLACRAASLTAHGGLLFCAMFAGRLKASASDRLLWKWVKSHFDGHDFARVKAGQLSNREINRVLNASPRNRGASIRLRGVVEHRRVDETSPLPADPVEASLERLRRGAFRPIYAKPHYGTTQRTTVLRIDCDAHHADQSIADARRFPEWLACRFPALAGLYHEPTTRGQAAWVVIEVPACECRNGQWSFPTADRLNRYIEQTADALKRLAVANGFKIDVELQGKINVIHHDDAGQRYVPDGGRAQHVRLPAVPDEDAARRLLASRTNVFTLTAIVEAAASLPPHCVAPAAHVGPPQAEIVRASHGLFKRVRDTVGLVDPGNKHSRRVQCVRVALQQVIRESRATVLDEAMTAIVIERANALYEARGYADGQRDKARVDTLARIVRYCVTHTDSTRNGVGGVWFGPADLEAAYKIALDLLPADDLKRVNSDPNLKRAQLTYAHFAIAISTAVKNCITSNGAVPVKSVQKMLRHFGLPSNGTQTKVLFGWMIQAGVIDLVQDKYGPGCCCKYAVARLGWSLPFARPFAPAAPLPAPVYSGDTCRPVSNGPVFAGLAAGLNISICYSYPDRVFGSNGTISTPHSWTVHTDRTQSSPTAVISACFDDFRVGAVRA
jgi:hypothetical protein